MGNNKRELMQGILDMQKAPYRSQRHHRQRPEAVSLSSFIEEVKDVDYINLFLTNLGSVVFLNLPTGAD